MARRAAEEELEAEFNRQLAHEKMSPRIRIVAPSSGVLKMETSNKNGYQLMDVAYHIDLDGCINLSTGWKEFAAEFGFEDDVGVSVPPDSDKSECFDDLVNVIFENPNPLEELANFAVNDSHGVPEDIANVVKDINDGMYSLNIDDGDGSLQLSVTQSQSVDGTEPVTQVEDVPMQLQLEDERIRKKKYEFQTRKELEQHQKAACVPESDVDVAQAPKCVGDEGGDAGFSTVHVRSHGSDMPVKTNLMQTRLTQVFDRDGVKEKKAVLKRKMSDRNPNGTQRRSPRVKAVSQPGNSKADADSFAVKIGPSKLGGSSVHRSPRGLTNKKPSSSPLQERTLLKENKKRKVHPTKVNKGVKKRARVEAEDSASEEDDIEVDSEDEFAVPVSVMSSVKPVGGNAGKVALDEGDQRKLNLTVRCSLREVEDCAKLLESRHVARVHASGFGSIFRWRVKSNISRPLMGVLYLRIDCDTMTLDMGEANKKLHITSNGIQQLFGFPCGGRSAPRPSEDGYDDALMKLRSELDISRDKDIKTKDLRNKLKVLVKDPSKDDLALKVFFIIVFMKVVLPGSAPRVSREAAMFDGLVFEDMANMDYCQMMVDELRRAVAKYQSGHTMGKAITGCAIGPVLMYLDCLIRGKTAEPDVRVPCICYMDPAKLSDLVDADLIKKKGNADPKTWVFGKLPVPTTVERLSCINGILPEGHQFNAEESVDYIEMERILIGDMRDGAANLVQSSVCLLNSMKRFRTMQNSRCKPYEESANVVIKQFEQDEAAATDSRVGDGTEANVFDHETNDVGFERPDVDIDHDEAAGTDSRVDDGTEANVSDQRANDVGSQHPVVDETSHNVEATVDGGVNDLSTDKCKGPIVGDEPCLPVGDVALNVSSNKFDDVAVNASKITIVEREVVLSGGDDAHDVPLSSGCNVGTKVADEDAGAASTLDTKSPGVGIAGNENVSGCEDLPPENFPPGGLDYGDALQYASSVEEVPSEDDDLLLSISSGPLTQEALLSSQDFLSTDPESASILVSSQDVPSSNPEAGGIMISSQELSSSSNPDSPGEWLDLGEPNYRFFGSQFLELERVAIDLSQGRSPDKRRSGVMKGRLGALRGFTAACVDSPTTPKNPIVELIDSDDDVFDKIAGVGRVTRSAAAKGLSPLAGIVARRAGGARKDPALDSGNVVVLDCSFYEDENKVFNVESAARDFKSYVKANEDLLSADLIMMPLCKPMVLSKDRKVSHYSLYVMNRYRSSVDILDSLPYPKNHRPSKNTYHKDCEKIISRLVKVMKVVYGDAQYNASKQPNWELFAKKPMFVKPRIVDWNAEDLYRVVFNRNNHLMVTELPKEVQALAPDA
ncbi:hypothetical protein VPH35_122908 [Triticum aestivum]